MKVLVTGGAGYIGSHAVRRLVERGHAVLVLDDLSHGHRAAVDARAEFIEGRTGDSALVARILSDRQVEAVLHFAADIEVGESVDNPGKYYENNFSNALKLLGAMRDVGVRKIVFSSTAAVYGDVETVPIEETARRLPINPYGRSKHMTELAIEDFSRAHGLGYAILRYFNVAGADPAGDIGEDHHPESHLIPKLLRAIDDPEGAPAKIFGTDYPTPDGTCIRDYVHVVDLVDAHILAVEKLRPGAGDVFNLGSERGFSVKEVIAACERVAGKKMRVEVGPRRPGDPPSLVAASRKAREILGWRPRFAELDVILAHALAWHRNHPHGYRGR